MSAFGGKADIVHGPSECPLLTQSGHQTPSPKTLAKTITSIVPWALISDIANTVCRRVPFNTGLSNLPS